MRLLLLALLATPITATAGEWAFELGSDFIHAKGLRAWSLSLENDNSRFRFGSFGQDGIEVKFFGAEYLWRKGKRCRPALGLVHVESLTPLNGTRWNAIVGGRCQVTKDVFIGLMHFSHARDLGIERDKTNNGFNFLTVGTRF